MNAIAERLQNGKVEAWKTWVTGERLIRWNEMMKRCKKPVYSREDLAMLMAGLSVEDRAVIRERIEEENIYRDCLCTA